jgi:tetratricopeptide (TPR) repeat protein
MKDNIMRSLLGIVVLALLATPASADAFDDAYEQGAAAYSAREYTKARAAFLRAYDLRPEPVVLYNIAQTYRLENNPKEAVAYYRRYLAESQTSEDLRQKSSTYIQKLTETERTAEQARLAKEAKGPTNPDGTPATVTSPPTTRPPVPVGTDAVSTNPRSPDVPTTAAPSSSAPIVVAPTAVANTTVVVNAPAPALFEDEPPTRTVPLGSKIAAGVAGAGLIAAIYSTAKGLKIESDFRDARDAGTASVDDSRRVEKYQTAINVSWAVTGVALASSVAIYFVAPSYTTSDRTIAVLLTRDGVSAAWTTSF